MNILHINAGSLNSGSGRGVYWLHQGLISNGINSKILCSNYDGNDSNIICINNKGYILRKIEKAFHKYILFSTKNYHSNIFGINIKKYECYKWADIIHLHWVNGLIGIFQISNIDKPVVWTLRDMWALTGGCFYSLDCIQWKKNCISCPEISSKVPIPLLNQTLKKEKLNSKIVYVAISKWLKNKAKDSTTFNKNEVFHIPNSINLKIFSYDTNYKQRLPFVKDNDFVISVGAQNLLDKYKGGEFLIDLLNTINFKTVVLSFGNTNLKSKVFNKHIHFFYLGFVNNDTLCSIYSASNVFLMTSTMEAFGKTVVESLACGTPVICVQGSGPSEIISHMEDGFIASRNSIDSFLEGILFFKLKSKNYFMWNCQKKSKKYCSNNISKKYIELYNDIL